MKRWFGMHEAVTRDLAVAEVDRYIVWSGQSMANGWSSLNPSFAVFNSKQPLQSILACFSSIGSLAMTSLIDKVNLYGAKVFCYRSAAILCVIFQLSKVFPDAIWS